MKKKELSISSIYKSAWELFKKHLGSFVLIIFLGMLLVAIFIVPGALALLTGIGGFTTSGQIQFSSFTVIGIAIFAVAVVLAACASVVYSAALIKAIGNADQGKEINIKDVFKFGYENFWKILVATILAGLLIFAGFVLFIIPGIILGVFLQYVIFVVIFQKIYGLDAVKESYNLVKKHFWIVFLIFLTVVILQGAISWVPIVGSIIAFLLTPFWQIINYMTYKALKGLKTNG